MIYLDLLVLLWYCEGNLFLSSLTESTVEYELDLNIKLVNANLFKEMDWTTPLPS